MTPYTWHSVRDTVYVTTCTWHHVRDTVYVTPCTWHRVRDTVYVTPCTWHHVRDTLYGTLCTWHHVHDTAYMTPCTWHCVHTGLEKAVRWVYNYLYVATRKHRLRELDMQQRKLELRPPSTNTGTLCSNRQERRLHGYRFTGAIFGGLTKLGSEMHVTPVVQSVRHTGRRITFPCSTCGHKAPWIWVHTVCTVFNWGG